MDQSNEIFRLPPMTPGQCDQTITNDCGEADSQILITRKLNFIQTAYWSVVAFAAAVIVTIQPVFAAGDFWDAFSTIMKDIYGKLLGVSTIIAVTAATVALLIRMISRNQRAVDEASSWLKRILITWIILNTLGFIIAYLQPLIAGGQYNA